MILLTYSLMLCSDALFKLLDAHSDVDCINVLLLELGIEDVSMWHDVVEEFQKDFKSCCSSSLAMAPASLTVLASKSPEIHSVLGCDSST